MTRFPYLKLLCFLPVFLSTISAQTFALTQSQTTYQQAKQALKTNNQRKYQQLRQQLTGYPLTIYLDYQQLSSDFSRASFDDVVDYLDQYGDTPPGYRLRNQYLNYLGEQQSWKDYLYLSPNEPQNKVLKCYYYQANYHMGERDKALAGAETLWLHGRSQPDKCDPLFELLRKNQRFDDNLVWQRMQLAFKARQRNLLNYLGRSLSPGLRPWGKRLSDVYANPRLLRQKKQFSENSAINRSLVMLGIEKLSGKNPSQAVKLWQEYQPYLSFSADEQLALERYIGYQAMLRYDKVAIKWLDKNLANIANDKLVELRLRRALKQQDWQKVGTLLDLLSPNLQQSNRWRYWAARVAEKSQQDRTSIEAIYTTLAEKRSYYGFLAADIIGLDYSLNNNGMTFVQPVQLSDFSQRTLARITELKALDKVVSARSEWNNLLKLASEEEAEYLPTLAADRNWWDFAITGAIHNGNWDNLFLRFPAPYRQHFQQFARMRHLDEAFLLAVARRESSFFSHANSSKNGKGLMQLLPSTAKQVSRKIGFHYSGRSTLYQPSVNIRLGSAYIRHLMDSFNNNRLLTAAGYNAGPRNVDDWINDNNALPFDIWIETIPFRETREYVQAVLSYRLIYAMCTLSDPDAKLLTERERNAVY